VASGGALFQRDEPVNAIYVVRFGALKTDGQGRRGDATMVDYHLPGEMVGLGSVGLPSHGSRAVALEDTELCVIRIGMLRAMYRENPASWFAMMGLLGSAVSHYQGRLVTLGQLRAEERIATFLVDYGERQAKAGYSATEFVLRLSRAEIGQYLGLQLETTSRGLGNLARCGLIQVKHRYVRFLDVDGIRRLCRSAPSA